MPVPKKFKVINSKVKQNESGEAKPWMLTNVTHEHSRMRREAREKEKEEMKT